MLTRLAGRIRFGMHRQPQPHARQHSECVECSVPREIWTCHWCRLQNDTTASIQSPFSSVETNVSTVLNKPLQPPDDIRRHQLPCHVFQTQTVGPTLCIMTFLPNT